MAWESETAADQPPDSLGMKVLQVGLAVVGVGAHFVVGLFILVSGLAAPLWAVLALLIIWGALLVLGIRWWRITPLVAIAIPVAMFLLWLATLAAGGALLDWSA